ncbi:MAG: N-acetylglutaminylglutamine synthetase [Desulfobulbaceae bacterium]|nr:N-acetylglutaminylglutamine synthetase [Desulfobulbaceae bacterium]
MSKEKRLKENRYSKEHRLDRISSPSASSWKSRNEKDSELFPDNVVLDCGWGRLIMAHTFHEPKDVVECLKKEQTGQRDIALYVRDPHVVLSLAPQDVFLDPSDTYRLWFSQYISRYHRLHNFTVRRIRTRGDARAMNTVWKSCHMVPTPPGFIWKNRTSKSFIYLVAEDNESGDILGCILGVDHKKAFNDPENGCSFWCLAVNPKASHPGIGHALINYLADYFHARGRSFMDLSVLHTNREAVCLYEKLGFKRIPAFCVKHKNPINEPLFTGEKITENVNPYAAIIIDEALRRGITAEVVDAENAYFKLSFGGRAVLCRESLSELTTAIAMSRCDDKVVTSKLLANEGLRVPHQMLAADEKTNNAFLDQHGAVVVKPAHGEQGHGVSVNLTSTREMQGAVTKAGQIANRVIIEEYCPGRDLRLIVINFELVAAATREPPTIRGDGINTVRTLIKKQSRRREAATGGESRIPVDHETERCIGKYGFTLNSILPEGEPLQVYSTANLHTGGTIHDVTEQVHPELRSAAIRAARIIDIPVVGLDFMVQSVSGPEYVIIEANERPGLANHEPQPTAEKFIDLLFPQTIS